MDTKTKNAQIWVRDPHNRHELPFWQLNRTGLILARMDNPGPLLIDLRTMHPTILTADIDGQQVLKSEILAPGQHKLQSPQLSIVPAAASDRPETVVALSPQDQYLKDLGLEPDHDTSVVMPYLGEAGGVLTVKVAYFRYDNGQEFEFESDELIYKINSTDAFLRAVAENAHRIVIDKDPDDKHANFCGMAQHFDPEHDHHH